MLNKILWIYFLFICTNFSFAQQIEIRSLQTYTGGDQTSFPVLVFNEKSSPYLTISFDINSESEPRLNIIFRFCDKNWNPTNNIMLANLGYNTAYNLNYSLLPNTIKDAKYHYKGTFPDEDGYVTFPFSGKWQYYITESNDTSRVYGTGRFIVVRDPITLRTTIKREILETQVLFPADLARIFNLTVDFNLPDDFFPFYVQQAEIIENQKLSYPYVVRKDENGDFKQFYWDGSKRFTFTSKQIKPGNEYRQTNLRNTNIYSSRDVKAQFEGPETSRFFQEGSKDINGASILTPYNDPYADYLNVEFRLRAPSDFNKDVLIAGAFNNWQLDPVYKMNNSGGFFTSTINMKRGLYDYQYVAAYVDGNEISDADWLILEGNNWTTQNIYHVFIYYTDPNFGGYDRIIGYSKILSK